MRKGSETFAMANNHDRRNEACVSYVENRIDQIENPLRHCETVELAIVCQNLPPPVAALSDFAD
jgi:hypothetical protein